MNQKFAPVVVAPTYNNCRFLTDILHRIQVLNLPIIVVNDGSTDSTAEILANWQSQSPGNVVLAHPANQGKAAALRSGFAQANQSGFTHAVTIDTDGQLAPEDIPSLLEMAKRHPEALLVGTRDVTAADYPARSRWGRRASNLLVWIESGARVADSQCGLRVYPLVLVQSIPCRTERYGFETEIIIRAFWAGVPILGAPVSCRYLPPGEQISHFKPWSDSLRSLRMHARLFAAAHHPIAPAAGSGPYSTIRRRTNWKRLTRWINPMTAWREVRNDGPSRTRFAVGFSAGVFIGTLPLYGLQTVLSLFVARRLKLHPVSVIAGSSVSTPPLGPLLAAGSITLGHLMMYGSFPVLSDYNVGRHGLAAVLWPALTQWLIGGVVLGAAFAGLTFVCLDLFLRAAASAGGWVSADAAKGVE